MLSRHNYPRVSAGFRAQICNEITDRNDSCGGGQGHLIKVMPSRRVKRGRQRSPAHPQITYSVAGNYRNSAGTTEE